MDPVLKAVSKGSAVSHSNPNSPGAPVIFTQSEIKSGLWRALTCTKNGAPGGPADLIMGMFVLNNDAKKAITLANEVIALEKDILDGSAFVLTFAKPVTDKTGVLNEVSLMIELPVTGAEIKAHAHSMVALAKTSRPWETFGKHLAKSDKAPAASTPKGSRTAGLIW